VPIPPSDTNGVASDLPPQLAALLLTCLADGAVPCVGDCIRCLISAAELDLRIGVTSDLPLDLAIGVAGRAWAVDELSVGELAVSARVAVAAVSARGGMGALRIGARNLAGLA